MGSFKTTLCYFKEPKAAPNSRPPKMSSLGKFVCLFFLATSSNLSAQSRSLPVSATRPADLVEWHNESFSGDLDSSPNLLVVGSNQDKSYNPGTVFVYRRNGAAWNHEQVILQYEEGEPRPASNPEFGQAVAISDDEKTIFIGAPGDSGGDFGSVLLYRQSESGIWSRTGKLVAPNGEDLDLFGGGIAVSGKNLAVAAYRTNRPFVDSGSIYMFRQQEDESWLLIDQLIVPDSRESDLFGDIMKLEGDLLVGSAVTGELHDTRSQGLVYTYLRDPSDGRWKFSSRLSAPDGSSSDFFGSALAIQDDLLAVGARGRDVPTPEGVQVGQGSVYLYRRDLIHPMGWKLLQVIKSDDGAAEDWFGRSATFDGDTLFVGASKKKSSDGKIIGAAYAFRKDSNGIADNWRQVHRFDHGDDTELSWFGDNIVASENLLAIGARLDSIVDWRGGALYWFDRNFEHQASSHPLDGWRHSHFLPSDLSNPDLRFTHWGNNADPDLDGRDNILEYLANSSPHIPNGSTHSSKISFSPETLTWPLPGPITTAKRATPYLLSSPSPDFWPRNPNSSLENIDGTWALTLPSPFSNGTRHFFRVFVEEN